MSVSPHEADTLRPLLALSLIAALQPIPTAPQPPVRWNAPAGCPDRTRVRSQIEALLDRPLASDELRLEGTIEASPSGWRLSLSTQVGTLVDERTLDANDCTVLADAAALVAVVMLDPVKAADRIEEDAAAAELARQSPPSTEPASAPELPPPNPEPAEDPVVEPKPRYQPLVWARLRGGGEYGVVPGGTGSFDLALALGGFGPAQRLRVELAGLYAIGREATSRDGRVRVHLGAVAPRFCAALPAGPVEIPLCAGVEVGAMRGDDAGGKTTHALWIAGHLEPGVRWSFSERASLWASAQVVVPMRYPKFELRRDDGTQSVYQPEPVAARGLLGIEIRLVKSAGRR